STRQTALTASGDTSRAATGSRATAARRRARQQEIVASTRALFDARGMRSANIDDISRAVGINRAIIYRHFVSKEELFALTLADYLTELDAVLAAADDPDGDPHSRLARVSREFALYCLRYPAFVDCALALLGRPGTDLLEEISDVALARLQDLMGGQLRRLSVILSAGRRHREPGVAPGAPPDGERTDRESERAAEADLLVNALYMQALGLMHLARSGVVLRPDPDGGTSWAVVDQERIVQLVTRMTLAVAFPSRS
ncbi:MAG TPA: helix-turn-helix domain-containing protein, partial [Kineosporiaceae bacterium]